MQARKLQVAWSEIDTLLLDMDGTLLDLAFDNYFWLDLVPARFAEARGISLDVAHAEVRRRYAEVEGTLPWYCIDHWTAELDLDIRELKHAHRHLIEFLPEALQFLDAVRDRVKRLILVTNAHRETLAIKAATTRVDHWMDAVVSSHDYRHPKETPEFWARLTAEQQLNPARCLLLDDSLSVLAAARRFGIGHVVAVRRPDSRADARPVDEFASVEHVGELV